MTEGNTLKHFPLSASDAQRKNLEVLAEFLDEQDPSEPAGFHVGRFFSRIWDMPGGDTVLVEGTRSIEGEMWDDHMVRAFGVRLTPWCQDEATSTQASFLFDARWAVTVNSPQSVARRIRYALEHGAPADTEQQIMGLVPRCC